MSIHAKVEADGLHANTLSFFLLKNESCVVQCGPIFSFLIVIQIFFFVMDKFLKWPHLKFLFYLFYFCS